MSFPGEEYFIVKDPQTKEGVGGHTKYTVECSLLESSTMKRYSDFHALRNKLQERWPGLLIPNIPPKKIINNKDVSFTQNRCRMLNVFTQKIVNNFKFLFYSDEMKVFLASNDVEKDLSKLEFLYEDASERYIKAFEKEMEKQNQKEGEFQDSHNKINYFLNSVLVQNEKFLNVS